MPLLLLLWWRVERLVASVMIGRKFSLGYSIQLSTAYCVLLGNEPYIGTEIAARGPSNVFLAHGWLPTLLLACRTEFFFSLSLSLLRDEPRRFYVPKPSGDDLGQPQQDSVGKIMRTFTLPTWSS